MEVTQMRDMKYTNRGGQHVTFQHYQHTSFKHWLTVTYINGWNLNVYWELKWEFIKKCCFRFQQGIVLDHIKPQAKKISSNTLIC